MSWHLDITNIAGILEGETTIDPGLNAVRAENWGGKSSLILAIEAAMGTRKPLTDGADRGHVTLTAPEWEIDLSLRQTDTGIVREWTPYLEDEYDRTCAALYAFLTEHNEIREHVRNSKNLEDLLIKPLDLENIDTQIAELQSERSRVETELEKAESAEKELISKQKRLSSLEKELDELESKREAAEEPDEDGSREDLSDARAKRESIKAQIERLESSITRIEDRLAEERSEFEAFEMPDYDSIDDELAELTEKVSDRETDVELLRTVYTANKRVLEENRVELFSGVQRGLLGDSVECWVCGSQADTATIEEQLDAIQEQIGELEADLSAYRKKKQGLGSKKQERRQQQHEKQQLEQEIGDLEAKLKKRRESLDRKRESLQTIEEHVEELSDSVSEQEEAVTEIKSQVKYTRKNVSDLESEIETLEQQADQKPTLRDERESLSEEIKALRSRRKDMKTRTREAFSESITEIIDRFDTSYESARLTANFDLVVTRDGREVSLDALSEGEVVLLGLVAALAGFEAYDVAETVPVILVDSLGALTDMNLHRLMDYLTERSERVVCTAYPEQSSFAGHEIDPTEWSILSDNSQEDVVM
jgi:chromosome segregation ATPase